MKIFAKALICARWADEEYCLYCEGQYQTPIAMLSRTEVLALRDELNQALDEGKAAKRTAVAHAVAK
jgi:hypothetical protein